SAHSLLSTCLRPPPSSPPFPYTTLFRSEYNGFKLKAHYAGPALPAMTAEVERRLAENEARGREPRRLDPADLARRVEAYDPCPDYLAQLASYVDLGRIGRAGLRVAVDFMHGTGRGYLDRILAEAGVEVIPVRAEQRPDFGGIAPEPVTRRLRPARAAVIEHAAAAGLCLDGDADRVAAVDEEGQVLDAHRVFALLLQHLHEDRGLDGEIGRASCRERVEISVVGGSVRKKRGARMCGHDARR